MLIPKPDRDIIRKIQTNISHEHRCKNPQNNTIKSNPKKYKKNYTSQPSGIYFRYARLVQHLKINLHRDFPGSPVVKTPHFHCRGHGFDPWSGN